MPMAKEVMSKVPIMVMESDTVQRISEILTRRRISGVPVVDAGKNITGFVSERDIIASMSPGIARKKARDIMTKKLVTAGPKTPLEELSKLFSEKPIKYIPIVEGDRVVGVVSRKDVINKLLGYYY